MKEVFLRALDNPMEFIACFVLACIPALVWMKIFLSKHHVKKGAVIRTFIYGMLSAVVIIMYQAAWGDGLNLVFFKIEGVNFKENITGMVDSDVSFFGTTISKAIISSFFIYMSVGLLEEVLKHYAMVKADHDIFESVDDVIELSIVAALGFAFLENIGYFYALILSGQEEGLIMTFVLRSIFVVFIHVMCSGIYGAFYGIGYFAKPYMKFEMQRGKKFVLADLLHRVFHFKKASVFKERMIMQGLFIAVVLHGLYDFILDNPEFMLFGKPAYMILLPVYLLVGFWYLSHLLDKKENLQQFGHLVEHKLYLEEGDTLQVHVHRLEEQREIKGAKKIIDKQIANALVT